MKAVLSGVSKRYGDQWVLRDLNLTLEDTNVLMAPSGRGIGSSGEKGPK